MPRDIPTHEMLAHLLGKIEQRCKELGYRIKDCQRSEDYADVKSHKIAKHEIDAIRLHVEALWKAQVSRNQAKAPTEKPSIEIVSVLGRAQITLSDGKHTVSLQIMPDGLAQVVRELQACIEPLVVCRASEDGECYSDQCPQKVERKPHCPLPHYTEY